MTAPADVVDRVRAFVEEHSFEQQGLHLMDVTPGLAEALAGAAIGDGVIVRAGDLLSSKEAAVLIGVDRTTISRWKGSGYMPKPFTEVGAGPLWLRSTLEAFAVEHRRRADAAGRRPLGTAR